MTWYADTMRFSRPRTVASTVASTATMAMAMAMLIAAGCGSSSHAAFLHLLTPEPDAALTMADDTNPAMPGLQVTVTGEAQGLADGTQIDVYIGDDQQDDRVGIGEDGTIELQDVTLPPGTHPISLRTSTGSLRSDDQQYTFRALVITAPDDDQTLSLADDQDAAQAGVQIDVAVEAHAVEPSEAITLLVDGEPAGGTEMPNTEGEAVFAGVTLTSGTHTLGAIVTGEVPIAAEEISVTVSESCAAIDFISPKAPASGTRLTLGGTGSCPEGDAPFEISVEVSTDAGDGRPVELFVNNQPVASGEVQGSNVQFDGIALTNVVSANKLRVEVMNADGVTCGKDFPAEIFVDCAGPDCTLASPTPIDHVDAKGDLTLFLNAAHQKKGGFDIGVATDRADQKVSLIVDRDEKSALDLTSTKKGSKGQALFKAVKLPEGGHWIQGRCEDAAGNVTFTDEVQWVVDTVACDVEVTAPDADILFVPADDDDANAANGTQTVVTSTVGGGDCIAQRAAPCDPASGVKAPDFVPYDGTSPLLSTLTLDADMVNQTLCVEIQDRAENVGRGTLDARFRSIPPTLEIQSPDDGESFNALGNAGHTADAMPSTGACDAAFSIACTEVGQPVELHFDDASGALLATATCTAPGPAGFAGRAQLTKAFDVGGQTAVIVATQTVEGDSSNLLEGSSAAITITGDCVAPAPSFSGDPCEGGFIGVVNPMDTVTKNVVVSTGATDAQTTTLSVSNGALTSSDSTPDSMSASQRTFNDVLFGGVGTVTLSVDVADDLDNTGSAMCMANIVTDVPTLAVTAPNDNQQFGPGDGCNVGAGVFGVQVTAMADTDANRTATISVNGASTGATVSPGGGISQCVVVPDDIDHGGPSTITVRVTSTTSGAFREVTRMVGVHTVAISDPTSSQVLVAGDDCGGTGFAYQVAADVDAAHMGASYTIGAPASGTMVMGTVAGSGITGCLDLNEGPQTITVSIGGTEYAAVDVVVASMALATEITLTPSCPDPSPTNGSYRTDPVHLDWDTLANLEDYPGQFQSYTLRCAHSPVASAPTPEDWWSMVATDVALGSPPVTPASGMTAADIPYRVGDNRHCALRAMDSANQLTPITGAADVTCRFRESVLFDWTNDATFPLQDSTAIGDVNGDGIDDLLVGGNGRAHLVFGSGVTFPPAGAPNVTFTATSPAAMGNTVVGLGDFNGDGRNDFAIAWQNWGAPGPARRGQVLVFFGRPAASPWPSPIALDSATCPADLCIKHANGDSRFGNAAVSAGDFDNDGLPDLAVGATDYPANADVGQLIIVKGNAYQDRTCGVPGDCRATETCMGAPTGTCQLMAGQDFWGLDYEVPSGNWLNAPAGMGTPVTLRGFRIDGTMGTVSRFTLALAPFGAFDSTPGDDLVVSAPGCTMGSAAATCPATISASLYFLSGHPYTLGALNGLDTLTFSRLGFRDGGGTPSGLPFESGQSPLFGNPIASAGNVYDDPGAGNPGKRDLLVKPPGSTDYFYLYPGDNNFAPADRIQVMGPGSDFLGEYLASGFHPALSFPAFPTPDVLGDLDGDGLAEMSVSAVQTAPGEVYLWYSDAVDSSADDGALSHLDGSSIEPTNALVNTVDRVVRFVGDLNDDGHPDMLVSDYRAGAAMNQDRATLLY